jgi:hypothetical protein
MTIAELTFFVLSVALKIFKTLSTEFYEIIFNNAYSPTSPSLLDIVLPRAVECSVLKKINSVFSF